MRQGDRFVIRTHDQRCEDCDLRDALDPMGRPRTNQIYGYKLTHGCSGCGGSGRSGKKVLVEAGVLLAALTEKQRFVIELRYGFRDGKRYTLEQVAEMMGLHISTVAQHEEYAKKKLAKLAGIPEK